MWKVRDMDMQPGMLIAFILVVALGLALPFVPKAWYSTKSLDYYAEANTITPMASPSDEDLSRATLKNLWPLPTPSALFPKTDMELDRIQEWVNEKRKWALTVKDGRVRDAYEKWLEYVERRIRENREENITHKQRDKHEVFMQQMEEERKRANAISDVIAKPPKDI